LLAHWLLTMAGPLIPEDLYRVGDIGIDGMALLFSLLISVLTVASFALPPALRAAKADLGLALKEGSSGTGASVRTRRPQSALVVAQVGLAVVLLVSTLLAVRSFANMDGVDPGFEPENVLTMGLALPSASFPEGEQVAEFHRDALGRVESLPGVQSAAFTSPLPMNFETWGLQFTIEGRDNPSGDQLNAGLQYVSPGYFETMSIALLGGREFSDQDDLDSQRVAVVNQSMAERFWPEGDPIGQRLRFESGGSEVVASIVGVVADTKRIFLNDDEEAMAYFSQSQSPRQTPYLVVKTSGDPVAMTASVRDQIWSVRPNLPLSAVRSMQQVVDESLRPWRWSALILGAFSVFALILAGIGIYGVVAYATSLRTTEIGVRMAMGAQPNDIFRFVLRQALILSGIGIVLGGLVSVMMTRMMASFLFGIGSTDPSTYLAVMATLGSVALVAAMAPAMKASRTHPSVALRYD
jgi:putative ABC transport system permease protein